MNLAVNQEILILTRINDYKVEFISDMVRFYCGIDPESIYQDHQTFNEKFVHPEDLTEYRRHLRSIEEDEENTLFLRLKNKKGDWSRFAFKNRLYRHKGCTDGPVAISIASPVPSSQLVEEEFSGHTPQAISPKNDYQHLLHSLDDAFCLIEMILDKKGVPVDYLFIETNKAFERQINLKKVEGKTICELFPNFDEERLETYGKVATTGEPIRIQFQSKRLDNSWLDVFAVKVGGQNSSRVALIFRNITQPKLAEEKLHRAHKELTKVRAELEQKVIIHQNDLKESKKVLQTVFDTTNQAVAVFKPLYQDDGTIRDFRFVKVNKVLTDMYLQNDPTGRSFLETSKYAIEMGTFDALKEVMMTGRPLDNEFYFGKDGYDHWFRMTARSQKDLLIATTEDISERKAEAEQLRENVRFKEELSRATMEIIMIVNLDSFEVRYVNKDIFPEAGMTKEKIQGLDLAEIIPYIHPRDREKVMGFHKRLLKSSTEEILEIEVRLKFREVSWEWFNVRGKIFNRRDESWVEEYVLLVTNISEQKATQKALLEAEKLSIKGEVARTLAHELRNPLASIGMVREVLVKKLQISEKHSLRNYFDILSRSTKSLNDLVNNLLNSSNYIPPVLQKEDLTRIVEETVEKASDRIYLAGIRMVKKFSESHYILADKERLQIALLNIIVNASEATSPRKGIIEIEIRQLQSDILLCITDNGQGIEQDQMNLLFEAFYTNKSTGVGVGLSSVKTILDEHDARIKVKSTPGEGTCFEIFFPDLEQE